MESTQEQPETIERQFDDLPEEWAAAVEREIQRRLREQAHGIAAAIRARGQRNNEKAMEQFPNGR